MKKVIFTVFSIFMILCFSIQAHALIDPEDYIELPDPNIVLPDGSKIAFLYDDFYAYSIGLNNWWYELNTGDPWDTSPSGSGGLDLKVVSFNSSGNPDPFEEPVVFKTGPNFNNDDSIWGNDFEGEFDGPVWVDDLYNYLQDNFAANIPVFYFDLSQPKGQSAAGIGMMGQAQIVQAIRDTEDLDDDDDYDEVIGASAPIATWSFDLTDDDAWGTIPDDVIWTYDPIIVGTEEIKANIGSGHPEYVAYAETMNLANFIGDDNLFFVDFRLYGDKYEVGDELYLTGKFIIPSTTIPEPGTLAMLGMGLFSLLGIGIRRKV